MTDVEVWAAMVVTLRFKVITITITVINALKFKALMTFSSVVFLLPCSFFSFFFGVVNCSRGSYLFRVWCLVQSQRYKA